MRYTGALAAPRPRAVALLVAVGACVTGCGSSRQAIDQTTRQAVSQSSTAAPSSGPVTQLPSQAAKRLLAAGTALLDLNSAAEAAAVRPLLKQLARVQVAIAHEIPGDTATQLQNAQQLDAILRQLAKVAPELVRFDVYGQPVGVDSTKEPALLAIPPPTNAPEMAAAAVSTIISALTNVTLKTAVGPNVAGEPVFTVATDLDSSINALKAIGVPGLASELQRFADGLPPG